ncbi:hypothetical protein [Parageobacillus thermoglucosidasius]|uniref:hypothetical protein n=1 Tax=Parageobacillus thermoglucosidasius TaxID=1426 RepID=UPI0001D18235|nr:hypothetical protein [Parageobacillus thermoglucosidasius]AEH47957.1 hypothetical protein Geoth_2010 [Parageobacillus thermoglucosidasius C56-YS93]OUM91039.1 MAG: hypothetical protein BAA00_11545 [Parageobacillus thermoglucosidasius]GCD82646.1 hypothetical protein PTHTG4_17080 [Parageobacillus thermoglucosidasius]
MNRNKDKKETKKKEEQTQQTSNEDNVIRELEEEFNADIRKGQFAAVLFIPLNRHVASPIFPPERLSSVFPSFIII